MLVSDIADGLVNLRYGKRRLYQSRYDCQGYITSLMRFLFIAQTPSKNTSDIADAAFESLKAHALSDNQFIRKTPLEVSPSDIDDCDGLLLGTLENIGALSGLTKDMFDRCYNEWLGRKEGLPVAIYIRAGLDGTATKRTLTSYANALSWRLIKEPMILHGPFDHTMRDEAQELAGMLSAGLEAGIY